MFKKTILCAAMAIPSFSGLAVETGHIFQGDMQSPVFECRDQVNAQYSAREQKLVDTLWNEALIYLKTYADALTTSTSADCLNSDIAVYETTTPGFSKMCIMENEDMKKMVKHIYQIVNNPDAAKKCFAPRKGESWLTMPDDGVLAESEVAQWIDRPTISEYIDSIETSENAKVHADIFARNFSKMATGDDIIMPQTFARDVSANALPNLWASVGWVPMYAADSERNQRNFDNIRGGYAYAEILGHWGLLRINAINGEEVGAEVGMVVQQVDTFYPYHNHAISEIYYTIRQPACANQFKTFAVREGNSLVKTVSETTDIREVELDTNYHNEQAAWASSEPLKDPLTYFHANTIHAFEIDADCDANPHEKAIVTVWARSNANKEHNDYGNTRLCESADSPNTPAIRGEKIRCDLTKQKW